MNILYTGTSIIEIDRIIKSKSKPQFLSKYFSPQEMKFLMGKHFAPQVIAESFSAKLAFARAILPDFTVLFGDEPTGNLDSDNAMKAMELLALKLEELPDSSAIIVSHDMNLALSFADMIIKIKKEKTLNHNVNDEISYFGFINDECVFIPSQDKSTWSNGKSKYSREEFLSFLKRGESL